MKEFAFKHPFISLLIVAEVCNCILGLGKLMLINSTSKAALKVDVEEDVTIHEEESEDEPAGDIQ